MSSEQKCHKHAVKQPKQKQITACSFHILVSFDLKAKTLPALSDAKPSSRKSGFVSLTCGYYSYIIGGRLR
jgi:hypothetical protein